MDYEYALEFTRSLVRECGRWLMHSEKTAEVAQVIASALLKSGIDIDIEKIRIMALFHDVGRSIGHGMFHGWDGFVILKEHGLEDYAKCAVSHWLKGRTMEHALREGSEISQTFIEQVFRDARCAEFSLEDKIVSLADSMTSFVSITSVEDRYNEARLRYGESAWLDTNEKVSLEIKKEFDKLLGYDLYLLFKEIRKEC